MNARHIAASDHAEWLRLRKGLWPNVSEAAHKIEMTAWLARNDAVVLVYERPGAAGLAGFVEVGSRSLADGCETTPVAYLEGWFVDRDVRGTGIGKALIHEAESWARGQGFKEFASDAELENAAAQKAHEAVGFREMDRLIVYLKAL